MREYHHVGIQGSATVRAFWARTFRDAFVIGLGQRVHGLRGDAWHPPTPETLPTPKRRVMTTVRSDLRYAFRGTRASACHGS